MANMSTVDAREHFAEVVNRAAYGKERIGLLRHGKPVAAVVPLEDLELLERLETERDIADARQALAEAETEGTTSLSDLRTELDL